MSALATLANEIDAWVQTRFPGAAGGFGGGQRLVYRVTRPVDSALKIWEPANAEQHERHVREVSALARITHSGLPDVVEFISQVDIAGTLFAMYQEAWLPAPSVKDQIASLPLDEATATAVLVSAAEVVRALHSENIVHRDISVGNLLWDGTQSFVIDFGLAKHLDLDSLTGTHEQLARTMHSASPEQLVGNSADLKKSTDVFSLAVVAFLVATGHHPYIRQNENLDYRAYIHRVYRHDIQYTAPPKLDSTLRDMLNPVPPYRPAIDDVLRRLR